MRKVTARKCLDEESLDKNIRKRCQQKEVSGGGKFRNGQERMGAKDSELIK